MFPNNYAEKELAFQEIEIILYEFTIDETKETLDSYFEYTPLALVLSN